MKNKILEDKKRKNFKEEIIKEVIENLKFEFINYGYECMGLEIKIKYKSKVLIDQKL